VLHTGFECSFQSTYYSQCCPPGGCNAELGAPLLATTEGQASFKAATASKTEDAHAFAVAKLAAAIAAQPTAVTVEGDDACKNKAFGQCGGIGYNGDKCCPAGYNCTYDNDYYSGCNLEDLCLVVQYGQCGGVDKCEWCRQR
jgi:hypothetical protein